MPKNPDRILYKIVPLLIALLCAPFLGAMPGVAASALHFSFDRPIDGSAAPFILASSKGLFRAEGLNVTTDAA
ncbi:hypothetical protein QIG23_27040, partial [Klebsiella pneumoniae]|nr:hypothetical protein [Klebsiella pneumoniae]